MAIPRRRGSLCQYGRVSVRTSSAISWSATGSARSAFSLRMYCWILRTSAAPSFAARSNMRRWSTGSGPLSSRARSLRRSSAWPRTVVSRLLKSWATPIAIRPSISIRRRRVCSAAHDAGSRRTSPVNDTG